MTLGAKCQSNRNFANLASGFYLHTSIDFVSNPVKYKRQLIIAINFQTVDSTKLEFLIGQVLTGSTFNACSEAAHFVRRAQKICLKTISTFM